MSSAGQSNIIQYTELSWALEVWLVSNVYVLAMYSDSAQNVVLVLIAVFIVVVCVVSIIVVVAIVVLVIVVVMVVVVVYRQHDLSES